MRKSLKKNHSPGDTSLGHTDARGLGNTVFHVGVSQD